MFKLLLPVSVLALAFATGPSLAQQTGDETQTGSETATDNSQLDLGEPIQEGSQIGETYVKEKFGDWNLACIKTESGQDPCSLVQTLLDKNGNPTAEITLFRIEPGGQAAAGASVLVPLETLLPAQLAISVDGQPGKRYNYTFCNQIGCVANIGLTQDDIDAFKKGATATFVLRPAQAPDQVIELKLSLTGFTAGYDVVDVVANN